MVAQHRRVAVEELQENAAELLREMREAGTDLVVTVDGEPLAVIRAFTPADEPAPESQSGSDRRAMAAPERLLALREQLSAAWPQGVTGAEAIAEQRR